MARRFCFAKADSGSIFAAIMQGAVYMDAVITPHRSLSERGFIVLISIVTAANFCSAMVFVWMGAWPAAVFLAVDVVAVIVAFVASFNAAKRVERIHVTARDVRITHEAPNYNRVVWESPTAFTRVTSETEDERMTALHLALSGRETPVAQALSPGERALFARALQDAIHLARMERG